MSDARRTILDTSVELITERGVRGVSFREVARRAGVSHQAPYHHFGNLQGILRAIAAEGFEGMTKTMRAAAERAGPDPRDALIAAGVAYMRFATSHVGHLRVMFNAALVDIHDDHEPLSEAAATYATLIELTHAAHAAGYGAEHPAEVLAHLCWSTVHGISLLIVEGALDQKAPNADQRAHAQQIIETLGALLRRS